MHGQSGPPASGGGQSFGLVGGAGQSSGPVGGVGGSSYVGGRPRSEAQAAPRPIDMNIVIAAWREYAEALPLNEMRLKSLMRFEPVLVDGRLVVTVDNSTQTEVASDAGLLSRLRAATERPDLTIGVVVRDGGAAAVPGTNGERWRALLQERPELEAFAQGCGLQLE